MINPKQRVRTKHTKYIPQFRFCSTKYHNYSAYAPTINLEKIYINIYNNRPIVKIKYD